MVRTERLAVSEDRNGMLKQVEGAHLGLSERDVHGYLGLQAIARSIGHPDTMEYWKSSAYTLNFMEGYELKKGFVQATGRPTHGAQLTSVLAQDGMLLEWDALSRYEEIDPGNARLRALVAETVGAGLWRMLWMPPSAPYYQLGSPFHEGHERSLTKRLIFSGWQVVPKVIAALTSYMAEAEMMKSLESSPENSAEARAGRARLLDFARREGRLGGMPVLGLLYPSTTLARAVDPLRRVGGESDELQTIDQLLEQVQGQVDGLLADLDPGSSSGPADEAWYWAAPILLDLAQEPDATREWLEDRRLAGVWSAGEPADDESSSGWDDHVAEAQRLISEGPSLGRRPADLSLVLAQVALGGFGNVALRALSRIAGGQLALSNQDVRDAAGQVAWGLRTLFNLPDVTAMVRGLNSAEPYWRRVVEYSLAGGLQSVLDEYAHVLVESLGMRDKPAEEAVYEVGGRMRQAMGLRAANLAVDDIRVTGSSVTSERRNMRARFAARFGDERTDDGTEPTRADHVRTAFNSPFWPFVLASTSVGQEGLDFHCYCHAVVHWNLPPNPVDLEQREGRVHRYKGHAVRKNVAKRYGATEMALADADPWERIFELAQNDRAPKDNDLVPYWIYPLEGGAQIERHVPALPLSKDLVKLHALLRSLVVYRMAFGQPRQEDLVAYLLARLTPEQAEEQLEALRIDLAPPAAQKGSALA
jgi:hypothetical protein